MLRSLLMGVLAFSTASACKGSPDAPAVKAGVTAGSVLESSGTVTATRGTEKRAISIGQDVSGDDVIETAADGRVRIRIAHNHATWELGPGRKEMVGNSLAWKLPKQDAPATAVNEATLAAGRHAERETVTTTSTAPAPAAAAPASAAPGAPAPAPAEPAKVEDKTRGRDDESTRDKGAPPPPPMPPSTGAAAPMGGEGGRDAPTPAPARRRAAVAPPEKAVKQKSDPRAPNPVIGGKVNVQADAVTESMAIAPATAVKQSVDAKRASLVACMEGASVKLVLVVAKGKATFTFPAGVSDKAKACFAAVAATLTFPDSYALKLDVPLSK